LANVGQRILASLLDFLIIFGYSLICSLSSTKKIKKFISKFLKD
jgi:hypothetical protein